MLMPLPEPLKQCQRSGEFLDFELESGERLSCNLAADGWSFALGDFPAGQAALWRRIARADGSIAFVIINERGELLLEKAKEKLGVQPSDIVTFEVIDDVGRPTASGRFIVVIAGREIKVFEPNKLKTVAKKKLAEPAIAATFAEWGALIVQCAGRIELLPLPDVKADGYGTLTLPEGIVATLIPGQGVITRKEALVTFYIRPAPADPLFDPASLPLVEPPVVIKKLFGTSEVPRASATQVDASFKFKRSGGMLAETIDLMQQILVTANERSEKLSEMEIKADRLRESARHFKELARQFRK
jgi:hypothetical protein